MVSDRPCPVDGCEQLLTGRDERICPGCLARARLDLRDVPRVLRQLDDTAAGLGSSWREPGAGAAGESDHVPVSDYLMEVRLALITVLRGWVRVLDEERPARPESTRLRALLLSTPQGQASLLHAAITGHEAWAPDLASQLHAAIAQVQQACDRPSVRVFAGTCTCGEELTAHPESRTIACRQCGARWDVAASRAAMVEAAHDLSATAAVIERTLGPGVVTAAMIRGWKHRGALEVAYLDDAGRPCYRLADVFRLAREGAPPRTQKGPAS